MNTFTHYEQTILDALSTDGYNKPEATTKLELINQVFEIFKSEYGHEITRQGGNVTKVLSEWLKGLPSACSVPYWNVDILENAKNVGFNLMTEQAEDNFLAMYWSNCAKAFVTLKTTNILIFNHIMYKGLRVSTAKPNSEKLIKERVQHVFKQFNVYFEKWVEENGGIELYGFSAFLKSGDFKMTFPYDDFSILTELESNGITIEYVDRYQFLNDFWLNLSKEFYKFKNNL